MRALLPEQLGLDRVVVVGELVQLLLQSEAGVVCTEHLKNKTRQIYHIRRKGCYTVSFVTIKKRVVKSVMRKKGGREDGKKW
jgi:hypothetical protein